MKHTNCVEVTQVSQKNLFYFAGMLRISIKAWKSLAILWLIIITILFFLPGAALPKQGWLDNIHFDKWVHFGFFALLIFSWRFYFPHSSKHNWYLLGLALIYGFGVEAIQHYFIANRSFDIGDVVADMAGSFAGIWFWGSYIKK